MDRFDDIWKDRFNEEKLPVDDWNTPDDEVWKGIIPHVVPEKKKRRGWWWLWFGLGGLMLVISAIIFYPSANDNSKIGLEENVGTLVASSNDSNIVNSEIRNNNEINNNIHTNTQSEFGTQSLSVNVSPSKNLALKDSKIENSNSTVQKITPKNQNYKPDTEITDITNLKSPEYSNQILEDKALRLATEGKNDVNEKVSFSEMPSLEVLLLEMILPDRNLPTLELVDIKIPSEKKLSFGFSAGAVNWKHRISDSYITDLEQFEFIYDDNWGWQTSVDMKWSFNKYLEGMIGVQYEQINTTSGHNSLLTYDTDLENPSNALNGFVLSLATPYGLAGATFNLIRVENIGTTAADLLVDFHSEHTIKNISIPVGLNIFPLGKKKKIVPSLSVGFGTNYLASISNRIQSIETHHSAIQFDDSGSSTFVAPVLEKWHFDYRLGLGVTYSLSSSSSIRLNYDWSKGINPIFKLQNYNTRINRHHLSIGFNKRLLKP